jgi:hypothetical protein
LSESSRKTQTTSNRSNYLWNQHKNLPPLMLLYRPWLDVTEGQQFVPTFAYFVVNPLRISAMTFHGANMQSLVCARNVKMKHLGTISTE